MINSLYKKKNIYSEWKLTAQLEIVQDKLELTFAMQHREFRDID